MLGIVGRRRGFVLGMFFPFPCPLSLDEAAYRLQKVPVKLLLGIHRLEDWKT
jgi:hypothetical protein